MKGFDSFNKHEVKHNRLLLWEFRNIHGQGSFSDVLIKEGEELYNKYSIRNIKEMVALWIIVGVKNFDAFDFDGLMKRTNTSKEEIEEILKNNQTFCKELLPLRFYKNEFEQNINSLQNKLKEKEDTERIEKTIKRASDWVLEKKIVIIEESLFRNNESNIKSKTEMSAPHTSLGYKIFFKEKVDISKIKNFISSLSSFKEKNEDWCPNGYFINEQDGQTTEIIVNDSSIEKTDYASSILLRPHQSSEMESLPNIYRIIKEAIVKFYKSFNIYVTAYIGGPKLGLPEFILYIDQSIKSIEDNISSGGSG